MATFNSVWSIDLGKSSLKAVKLRREGNNIEILAIDKIDFPIGTNGVDAVQQAKEALNAFKIRNQVGGDPVVVAHPGQGTFSRFIKVPAFEAKKLKEMVGHEASQQIPFPLDEVIWDYHLVNRDYLNGEERDVGLFAVRKEAIDDYLLDFTSNGLSVEVLSIGYLGLLNYILYDLAPDQPSIFLDIGATHTDLILLDGKRFWIRALPHSGNDINKTIMDRFKVSFQEAEKLKVESSKAPQQAAKIFSTVIQPKLKELVSEIHRSVGYYRSQAGDVKFVNLFLLGNGSRIVGIKKYLAEQLGVEVHRMQTLRHFRINREVDLKLLQSELPAFGTAFGCAIQGLGVGSCKVDLIPQEERQQKELGRKKRHVFFAMGVVLLGIFVASWIVKGRANDAREALETHRSWLKINIDKYKPSKKGAVDELEGLEKKGQELRKLGQARGLALAALRSIGAVLPRDNEQTVSATAEKAKKSAAEGELKGQIAELNKQKVWIPKLEIERVEWPEDAASAKDAKVRKPTVPAYRVKVFAVVVQQADPAESLALIQKLFIGPLETKLKEGGNALTLDPKVTPAPEYQEKLLAIYVPVPALLAASGEGGGGGARRGGPNRDENALTSEAGPFFGDEITFYLRVDEPKEEKAATKAVEEEEPAKKKKPKTK